MYILMLVGMCVCVCACVFSEKWERRSGYNVGSVFVCAAQSSLIYVKVAGKAFEKEGCPENRKNGYCLVLILKLC